MSEFPALDPSRYMPVAGSKRIHASSRIQEDTCQLKDPSGYMPVAGSKRIHASCRIQADTWQLQDSSGYMSVAGSQWIHFCCRIPADPCQLQDPYFTTIQRHNLVQQFCLHCLHILHFRRTIACNTEKLFLCCRTRVPFATCSFSGSDSRQFASP